MPVIRAIGQDLVYELRIAGGVMATDLFLPAGSLRLFLRCAEDGEIWARDGHVRAVQR
jgi:hypothetical protein